MMPSLHMSFRDCLFFGAIISATDPGIGVDQYSIRHVNLTDVL